MNKTDIELIVMEFVGYLQERKETGKTKDKMFQISLLNCSIHKIDITSTGLEEKYYIVPTNLLKSIFNIKELCKHVLIVGFH